MHCQGITAKGTQCSRKIPIGQIVCHQHGGMMRTTPLPPSNDSQQSNGTMIDLGNNKIIFNNCLDTKLKAWTPIKYLGRGFNGSVYEVCKVKDCNYVLKIISTQPGIRKTDSEAEISIRAGDLGIGPSLRLWPMRGN